LTRNFTARSLTDCEILGLSKHDVVIMKMEFIDEFTELFKDSEQMMSVCIKKGMEAAKKFIKE
jgi:hypothetical protein